MVSSRRPGWKATQELAHSRGENNQAARRLSESTNRHAVAVTRRVFTKNSWVTLFIPWIREGPTVSNLQRILRCHIGLTFELSPRPPLCPHQIQVPLVGFLRSHGIAACREEHVVLHIVRRVRSIMHWSAGCIDSAVFNSGFCSNRNFDRHSRNASKYIKFGLLCGHKPMPGPGGDTLDQTRRQRATSKGK